MGASADFRLEGHVGKMLIGGPPAAGLDSHQRGVEDRRVGLDVFGRRAPLKRARRRVLLFWEGDNEGLKYELRIARF